SLGHRRAPEQQQHEDAATHHRALLLELELHREEHPRGNGLRAFSRWLEAPLADGIGRRPFQIGTPGRGFDDDLTHVTGGKDLHLQPNGALDAEPSSRGRITRLYLIPTLRMRPLRDPASRRSRAGCRARGTRAWNARDGWAAAR